MDPQGSRRAGRPPPFGRRARRSRSGTWLPVLQSAYYLGTGVWPLLHMRSFERVTGPKVEHWLVQTVGVMTVVIGATLGLAALRGRSASEAAVLGAGAAIGFAGIDIVHASRGRIPPIYLTDAALQLAFLAGWRGAGREAPG